MLHASTKSAELQFQLKSHTHSNTIQIQSHSHSDSVTQSFRFSHSHQYTEAEEGSTAIGEGSRATDGGGDSPCHLGLPLGEEGGEQEQPLGRGAGGVEELQAAAGGMHRR